MEVQDSKMCFQRGTELESQFEYVAWRRHQNALVDVMTHEDTNFYTAAAIAVLRPRNARKLSERWCFFHTHPLLNIMKPSSLFKILRMCKLIYLNNKKSWNKRKNSKQLQWAAHRFTQNISTFSSKFEPYLEQFKIKLKKCWFLQIRSASHNQFIPSHHHQWWQHSWISEKNSVSGDSFHFDSIFCLVRSSISSYSPNQNKTGLQYKNKPRNTQFTYLLLTNSLFSLLLSSL